MPTFVEEKGSHQKIVSQLFCLESMAILSLFSHRLCYTAAIIGLKFGFVLHIELLLMLDCEGTCFVQIHGIARGDDAY